jgi:hypothetical protein
MGYRQSSYMHMPNIPLFLFSLPLLPHTQIPLHLHLNIPPITSTSASTSSTFDPTVPFITVSQSRYRRAYTSNSQ